MPTHEIAAMARPAPWFAACTVALIQLLCPAPSQAQKSDASSLEQRCWSASALARTQPDLREPTAVSFGTLRNGDVVRAPFWLDFGIRGMGVIPAGHPHERAGHHHLLVDKPLPSNHRDKIPFSDTHRHFGKAQTGTLLDLPPGRHTLRLLFADHDHRPYFVYSPEIAITVEGRRSDPAPALDAADFAASCRRWLVDELTAPHLDKPHVYLRNIHAHDALPSAAIVGLGVVGYGVAPRQADIASTGYFVLTASRAGSVVERKELSDGRTETLLELPRGAYLLQAQFISPAGLTLLASEPVPVVVNGSAPL